MVNINLDMALHLGRTELELQATNLLIYRHRSRLCLLQYINVHIVHGHWHCSCTMICDQYFPTIKYKLLKLN